MSFEKLESLNECFRCGEDTAQLHQTKWHKGTPDEWSITYIHCTNCGAMITGNESREGAIEDWNRKFTTSAYEERNRVVAVLARLFPSGIRKTDIEGWKEEWHNCVYIDLPTGQASWHYHDSLAHLFEDLPPYEKPYDGHTTEEKYQRLALLLYGDNPEAMRRAIKPE